MLHTVKTVIITGANRGIGLQLAVNHLKRNSNVIAAVRATADCTGLEKLARDYGDKRLQITSVTITDEEDVKRWVRTLKTSCSISHVDLLYNNAGTIGAETDLLRTTKSDMMDCFHVNCVAPLTIVQVLHSERLIGGAKQTCIVNISSNLGSIAMCYGSYCAYRVSKAALNMLTKNISVEMRDEGIVAVALHPGWVRTDMGGQDASISAEESASEILNVLEKDAKELQGGYFSYTGERLPF